MRKVEDAFQKGGVQDKDIHLVVIGREKVFKATRLKIYLRQKV